MEHCAVTAYQSVISQIGDPNEFGQCRWYSDSQLFIDLGPGATILPGDVLTLKAGALRSKNSISHPSISAATVSAPLVVKLPTVFLSGAQVRDC